ncbi:VOC family protein [Streptomyces sp. NPDC058755]|uniref:VOC family protein n=1 Tax=Streptomyces sp. NPDC058755 TaxID=3346624 RepID=UPI0036C119F8
MFTDETAACMLVGEHAFVMLLSREKFAEFAKLPMADPTTHTLALYCFSVSSREEVDTVSAAALAAGDSEADGAEDYGFMYSRSFFDLDGHGWRSCGWTRRRRSRAPRRSAARCRLGRPKAIFEGAEPMTSRIPRSLAEVTRPVGRRFRRSGPRYGS